MQSAKSNQYSDNHHNCLLFIAAWWWCVEEYNDDGELTLPDVSLPLPPFPPLSLLLLLFPLLLLVVVVSPKATGKVDITGSAATAEPARKSCISVWCECDWCDGVLCVVCVTWWCGVCGEWCGWWWCLCIIWWWYMSLVGLADVVWPTTTVRLVRSCRSAMLTSAKPAAAVNKFAVFCVSAFPSIGHR